VDVSKRQAKGLMLWWDRRFACPEECSILIGDFLCRSRSFRINQNRM